MVPSSELGRESCCIIQKPAVGNTHAQAEVERERERDDIVKGRYLYKVIFGRAAASAFIGFFSVVVV